MDNAAYTVAHSPDADDIFMYYAIKFGWVTSPFALSNVALDIETLNKSTLEGIYDISAISFALYPHIANSYALLRTGMSFGNGYGPKIVKLKDKILKKHFKVALSGENTTNAMLFRLKYPEARIYYMNFLDIEGAVLDGSVDAGVLIHESILNFSSRLEVYAHVWDIWLELCKEELPLPLGGMALRRSIPLNKAIILEEILSKAIKIGLKYKPLLSNMLLENKLVRVDSKDLDTYLNLYANDDSHSLSAVQIRALDKMYKLGYEAGVYRRLIKTEDYLIPKEYKELRYS